MPRPGDEALEMLKVIADADNKLEAILFLRLAGFKLLPPMHDAVMDSANIVVMAVNKRDVSYWDSGRATVLSSEYGSIHRDLQKWL